ncbi:MAG: transposase [Deltaproteobacteria bacterium]|nr:transposase [Deltaproteobacteria bacterium]
MSQTTPPPPPQLRRRGRALGIRDGRPAAITAIQVFGGALNLNVHFHVIAPDALFVADGESLHIEHLPPPTDEDIDALLATVRRKVARLFERGLLAVDEVASEEDASALQLAIAEAVALDERNGLFPKLRCTGAWRCSSDTPACQHVRRSKHP